MKNRIGNILVVGGGISGIRSSLDLAEMGYSVLLIDRSPFLGGILSQLDYQFPTDHCGMCKMLPMTNRDLASQYCLRKGFYHKNIDMRLATELVGIEGEPGKYTVTLKHNTPGIDPDRCNGCGACLETCQVEAPDNFNLGLSKRKAVYRPVPHNFPHIFQIDFNACNLCGECVTACPTRAIRLPDENHSPTETQVEVGAVILSGGTDYFTPDPAKDPYGYHTFPDVVTSREFERLISGTGPDRGKLNRLSDGKPIRSIAWFQCVGSRDLSSQADFCSSVCCMHAIKEARLVHEKFGSDIQKTVFYMDLRTAGKTFQHYRDEAQIKHGVHFERARVHTITFDDQSQQLAVRYLQSDGTLLEDHFDLIVLAVGQRPAAQTRELADLLDISVNRWGYCEAEPFSSVITNQEGIVLSGSYTGLKDISESLIQAGSAAMSASRWLHHSGKSLATESERVEFPGIRETEPPRILAAICSCNGFLKDSPDMKALGEKLMQDPAVADLVSSTSDDDEATFEQLKKSVEIHRPNRLLMATELPHRFHQQLNRLAETIGLSPFSIEITDLNGYGRKGLTSPEQLTNFTRLLKTGLSKLKHTSPATPAKLNVYQKALVIGGGVAGMAAALSIAENGYEVDLVEKDPSLGGLAGGITSTIEGYDVQAFLSETVEKVSHHPLINVHLNAEIADCFGHVGCFTSVLSSPEQETPSTLYHGTVIFATGGQAADTKSYQHGASEKIVTQQALEAGLIRKTLRPDQLSTVAMIQCVDSREEPRNYCSRVCCSSALKHALFLKNQNPQLDIFIFYRDMMALGFEETYYTEARKAGVIFVSYQPDSKPQVEVTDHEVAITAVDPIFGKEIKIQPDLLVLATGMVPTIPVKLAEGLQLELDRNRFFQEAEPKWRPLDSLREGVFYCGICLSPRNITDSVTSGEAAAQRSLRILCDETLYSGKNVAQVRESLCSTCEKCIDACPYQARSYDPESESVLVNPIICQGCGSCAVVCPNSASILEGFVDQQMFEMIDGILTD